MRLLSGLWGGRGGLGRARSVGRRRGVEFGQAVRDTGELPPEGVFPSLPLFVLGVEELGFSVHGAGEEATLARYVRPAPADQDVEVAVDGGLDGRSGGAGGSGAFEGDGFGLLVCARALGGGMG